MIELVIDQRRKDLGGFEVGRVLPFAQAPDGRAVHLLRPHGAGGFRAGHPAQRRRAAASAHRPVDRHLPVRRRDHASRQRRLRAGDPAGRGQLDDRRARHHPLRALRAGARATAATCTASRPGWRCRRRTRRPSPAFAHHGADDLPTLRDAAGSAAALIAGEAFGRDAPVKTHSPMFYVHWTLRGGRDAAAARRISRARGLRRARARSRSTASVSTPARCWCSSPGSR